MLVNFTKMHGLGNDFVVIDERKNEMPFDANGIRALGDRHTGIGFDQLLGIDKAGDDDDCAFRYSIWNSDGQVSGQCGNGVRCVAAWLHRAGELKLNQEVRLRSPSGPVSVRLIDAESVTVNMGEPDFEPSRIPFDTPHQAESYPLDIDGAPLTLGSVSMGNPHAVVQVEDLKASALQRLGPQITTHPRFPEGCNTSFVKLLDRTHVHMRVHERGSGWTQACGTGACATMAVLRLLGKVDHEVDVRLPGGHLMISWDGPGKPLWMTGPACFVFEGRLHVDA
ncbi:diaminopimelate epimerase [Oleiagrimonas sp.]|jgi:diaminopimelate epimerase|uniref:diaminopimelate epimerase n=1 Tax=Oleiagrimonas sp. TaxID=2010330 RepID=UPI00260BA85F|nr:diaminopimelate epimerase [Oleiagrimonas sp.]MDA3915120.1 diaminopimelate epimerase [Oleiagrimonas sp.]